MLILSCRKIGVLNNWLGFSLSQLMSIFSGVAEQHECNDRFSKSIDSQVNF
jgi:hypothetical protein